MCLGVPGKIIKIDDEYNAIADVSGVTRQVNISYLSDDDKSRLMGCWVLIHVGFAMSIINEEDAIASLKLLSELGEFAKE